MGKSCKTSSLSFLFLFNAIHSPNPLLSVMKILIYDWTVGNTIDIYYVYVCLFRNPQKGLKLKHIVFHNALISMSLLVRAQKGRLFSFKNVFYLNVTISLDCVLTYCKLINYILDHIDSFKLPPKCWFCFLKVALSSPIN